MQISVFAKGAIFSLALAAPAGAATLDFSGLTPGVQNNPVLTLPNATLTGGTDDLFYKDSDGSICAFNLAFNCQASLEIQFNFEVSNLSFEAYGYNPGDSVTAFAFDSSHNQLDFFTIEADGVFDFGALGGISRLYFADSSTGAGFTWGNFQFDETTPPPAVPLPASFPMLLGAMAFAGAALRRRRG